MCVFIDNYDIHTSSPAKIWGRVIKPTNVGFLFKSLKFVNESNGKKNLSR